MKLKKPFLFFLMTVILLGTFLRLCHLRKNVTFNWDQERTATLILEAMEERKLVLIGPRIGPGKLFLGPLYYYLVAPFLILTGFNPIGLYYSSALIGIATGILVYLIAREIFNEKIGLISSGLYFLSPLMVFFDRIPWNVNFLITSFLLIIYGLFRLFSQKKPKLTDYLILGLGFGLGYQAHFSSILFLPFLPFLFFRLLILKKIKEALNLGLTFLLILIFLLPLLIFDLRHDFFNLKMLVEFFQTNSQSLAMFSFPQRLAKNVFTSLNLVGGLLVNASFSWMNLFLGAVFLFYLFKKSILFFLFYFLPILFLSFYKGETPEYYFFWQIPVIIFFLAKFLVETARVFPGYKRKMLVAGLLIIMFWRSASLAAKHRINSLFYKQKVTEKILEESRGNEFKVSYIMEKGEDVGFNYFFVLNKKKPVAEAKLEFFISFPYDANKGFEPIGAFGLKEKKSNE